MTDLPDQPNRDAALLRAEQNFFEQAQVQHQHQTQKLSALQAQLAAGQEHVAAQEQQHQKQLAALDDTIQILRRQLAQAQEEIGTANGRLEHTLATQIPPITLVQLAQAQEELAHALRQLDALQQWQHLAQHSLKLQLKLLIKSLLRRLSNRLRWLIPLQGARRIKSLLIALKQRLSALRH